MGWCCKPLVLYLVTGVTKVPFGLMDVDSQGNSPLLTPQHSLRRMYHLIYLMPFSVVVTSREFKWGKGRDCQDGW